LPPVSAPHIIARLWDIGPVEPGGMGGAPISWRTLQAWQDVTGVTLQPWEAQLLKRLSAEYLAEHSRAEDSERPAPFVHVTPDHRRAVTSKIRAFFNAYAAR
jgi:hypothetical protein